jgi:hypothetical protein
MKYNIVTAQYAIVEDIIEVTFSALGERDSKTSFTIEGAEQYIIELKHQIQLAKEARTRIMQEDIEKQEALVKEKQDYINKRKHDLKTLLECMGSIKEVKI